MKIMSIAKNFEETLGFLPHDEAKGLIARVIAQVGLYIGALRDGLAAAHKYSALTSRGVPHDAAVHAVFKQHLKA
jgi:hypothetical protein